jgi:Polyketide cyclase / dehydrase and lipid transport
MTRIAVSRTVPVSHDRVWAAIADLASHEVWMKDAERIVFVHDQRRGKGTRMEVVTLVGPFRTIDVMEVVGWDEGHSIEVTHQGLIKGRGILAAAQARDGTLVSWQEELTFPWWLGGPITAWLARPVLAAIWRGNLARLEESL